MKPAYFYLYFRESHIIFFNIGAEGGMQAQPQNVWFGENPGKIRGEIRAKCVNTFTKSLYVLFDFTKITLQIKVQTFYLEVMFFWRSCSGKLGEFWPSLEKIWAKVVLEVLWFEKMRPTWKEMQSVSFGGHFISSIFRASLGNLGKNPSHTQKFACCYTYVFNT